MTCVKNRWKNKYSQCLYKYPDGICFNLSSSLRMECLRPNWTNSSQENWPKMVTVVLKFVWHLLALKLSYWQPGLRMYLAKKVVVLGSWLQWYRKDSTFKKVQSRYVRICLWEIIVHRTAFTWLWRCVHSTKTMLNSNWQWQINVANLHGWCHVHGDWANLHDTHKNCRHCPEIRCCCLSRCFYNVSDLL